MPIEFDDDADEPLHDVPDHAGELGDLSHLDDLDDLDHELNPPRPGPLDEEALRHIDAYWEDEAAADRKADEEDQNRKRGKNKDYDGTGVSRTRMSQSETSLRCVKCLGESRLIRGPNLYLRLGAAELRRRDGSPIFPVKNYLSRWGFAKEPNNEKYANHWGGFYTHTKTGRKLLLNFDKFDGHIMAFFVTGQRLIVHCIGGNIGNTRSPAEQHDFHRAVGRAVCWMGGKPDDITAICTPRSQRFRALADERREAAGVKSRNLLFLQVDRAGGLSGLTALES
jgi:hypothetical protein